MNTKAENDYVVEFFNLKYYVGTGANNHYGRYGGKGSRDGLNWVNFYFVATHEIVLLLLLMVLLLLLFLLLVPET